MTFLLDHLESLSMIPPADYPASDYEDEGVYAVRSGCQVCGGKVPANRRKYCSESCSHKAGLGKNKGGGGQDINMVVAKALAVCPYASGAIKMPDGGRAPCPEIGF